MVEFMVKLGTDNFKINADEADQLVTALSQHGFSPTINVMLTASEGQEFQLLRTFLENNNIGWSVVGCYEIKEIVQK
jgi:hypothetical protein